MPDLPPEMVEAAAVVLHDAECPDRSCSLTVIGSVFGERAAKALAAALSVCEVREEWGFRSLWTRTTTRTQGGEPLGDMDMWQGEQEALARMSVRCAESVPRVLLHRVVFTTPTEVVRPTPSTVEATDGPT